MRPTTAKLLAMFTSLLLGLVILLITNFNLGSLNEVYKRLELFAYDLRMQAHLAFSPPLAQPEGAHVAILDIDEESLQKIGRWPWSRATLAQLVNNLAEAGAAVIGFDVLFGEAERNPANEVLSQLEADSLLHQQLSQLESQFDYDLHLAQLLEESPADVVLGYIFHYNYPLESGLLPEPLTLPEQEASLISQLAMPKTTGFAAPLKVLTNSAAGSGFFSLLPDADGVVRRAPLITRFNDQLYPALAVEMLRNYLFLQDFSFTSSSIKNQQHLDKVYLDANLEIPTDSAGQMLIPYRGATETFPYLPAWQLFEFANLSEEQQDKLLSQLEGALVLVGTSALGLLDLRTTPLDAVYPGVEVHANLLAAMLDKKFLHQPSWASGANFIIALLAGLVLALALPWLNPFGQFLLSSGVTLAVVAFTGWLWHSYGLVLALAAPLLIIFSLVFFNFVWGFFYEARNRNKLAGMFGQYVPPQLVEEMSNNPQAFSFDGESKELSVLFSDIRGFTTLSERLTADELKKLLNRYFTPITGIIFDHRGTIDKYIGDLVMAFWGAPVDDPDHAKHSILAAKKMLQATAELSATFVSEDLPAITVGIGINSGLMNVGDMGSTYRRAYTVLGDAVNLAARLESSTKYYATDLIVGERTQELAADYFVWRELDLVTVKGKTYPIRIYEPVCLVEEATSELHQELEQMQQAITAFRSQDFSAANQLFTQLANQHPNTGIYQLYLERLAELAANPPAKDWDGSWTRMSK